MTRVNRPTLIQARHLISDSVDHGPGVVEIEEARIGKCHAKTSFQAAHAGHYLIPGMIDLHINGIAGGDAALGEVETMSQHLVKNGVTGFLPTVITNRQGPLVESLRCLSRALSQRQSGAVALGIHLEGPFLSQKRRGAHPEAGLQLPSPELCRRYLDAADGQIRMLTLAPELPGALDLISYLRDRLPIVSLGHSAADCETTRKAIDAGANLATHVFNAMEPMHHRQPTILNTIFNDSRIQACVIADGVHVHEEAVRTLLRCKGASRTVLVTDAVAAAGMPDGNFQIGDLQIEKRGGVCRNAEGSLAGSALEMDQGLRNLVQWCRSPEDPTLPELVATATRQPAQLLGLANKGSILEGADADLVLLDENLMVTHTWVEGRLVYAVEGG